MNVNLSPAEFEQADLVKSVARVLRETGTDPEAITLEVTETAMMSELDASVSQLRALKALGVRLAIDDFGTGHSSLSYLQRLPVDTLKIDKAFVDAVAENAPDRQLMEGMLALAQSLDMEAVGEGVEEDAQARALQEMGCPRAQGFHFARPLTPEALRTWLAGQNGYASTEAASPAEGSTTSRPLSPAPRPASR